MVYAMDSVEELGGARGHERGGEGIKGRNE